MKRQQWFGLVIGVMVGISTMLPAQASVLSQSPVVTVTGGHTYSYTYWQEVQTGTQQVQTGTTTQSGYLASSGYSYYRVMDNADIMYPPVVYEPSGTTSALVAFDGRSSDHGNDYFIYAANVNFSSQLFPSYEMNESDGVIFSVSGTYTTVSTPVYSTEPVYTNEEFTGTAWSPASISYS